MIVNISYYKIPKYIYDSWICNITSNIVGLTSAEPSWECSQVVGRWSIPSIPGLVNHVAASKPNMVLTNSYQFLFDYQWRFIAYGIIWPCFACDCGKHMGRIKLPILPKSQFCYTRASPSVWIPSAPSQVQGTNKPNKHGLDTKISCMIRLIN